MESTNVTLACWYFAFGILVSSISLGCKKEQVKVSDPLSILTADKWYRTVKDSSPELNPKSAYTYYPVSDCQMDDRYEFSKSETFIFNPGDKKCSNIDALNNSNYSVDLENKHITLAGTQYNLLQLTPTRLKISQVTSSVSGTTELIYLFWH